MINKKQSFETLSDDQLRLRVDNVVNSKDSKVYAAKRLSQWFEISLVIKLFGVTILDLRFPPKNDDDENK